MAPGRLIVIGGPTASGKSALALRLADALGGTLINADSMQLYRDLRVLTARPSPADEAQVPHRLYGVLAAGDEIASAGRWLEGAAAAIGEAWRAGRVAIVVGGTGLYLHALLHGLAPVPEVPAAVRRSVSARLARLGAPALHAELARRDPAMAARLRPTDRQRLIRALEVLEVTGRSLAEWQAAPPVRVPLPERWAGVALLPPRAELHVRIEQRLRAMIAAGALAEVRALRAHGLPPDHPLLRAVGVPELLAHLEGRQGLEDAVGRAVTLTRRFAKRQLTWLRHQLPELTPILAFGDDPERAPGPDQVGRLLLTGTQGQHSVHCTNRVTQTEA